MSAHESNRTAKELTEEAQAIRDELMGSEDREIVRVYLHDFQGVREEAPPDVITEDGTIIRIILSPYPPEEAVEG